MASIRLTRLLGFEEVLGEILEPKTNIVVFEVAVVARARVQVGLVRQLLI